MTKWQLIDSLLNRTVISVRFPIGVSEITSGFVTMMEREDGGGHGWNIRLYSSELNKQVTVFVRTID